MFALDGQLVAEEDFEHRGFALLALAVARLDERADHWYIEGPHQIAHEHEPVFQDAEGDDGLAAVVVGDLTAEFANSFLYLVGRNDLTQAGMGRSSHRADGASASNDSTGESSR